jgi:arylformamidase
MPVVQGDPAVVLVPATSYQTEGYLVTRITLGSHSGTHLDAPRHLFPGGKTLDDYPLSRFVSHGVVLDVRPASPPGSVISRRSDATVDRILLSERIAASQLRPGWFALLWTEGALLTPAAARVLVDAQVGLVATDAPSLDEAPYSAHRLLLERDILIAENLRALEKVGSEPVTCAFLPLAVPGVDGAPVRAIAWR